MSQNRPPYTLHNVSVTAIQSVTPHMKRISIDGRDLLNLRPDLPAQWLKVYVGSEANQRGVGRAYTVRRFDPSTGVLDLDFALHGDEGPISAWAARAQVGDKFEVSDIHPRSGFSIEPVTSKYLLAADATGLPGLAAILEALPAHAQAHVFAEVSDVAEEQPLASAAKLTVTWLHRGGARPGSATPLESAVTAYNFPEDTAIWIAAESSQVAGIRRSLRERGTPSIDLCAAGYWKRGEADHRDSNS